MRELVKLFPKWVWHLILIRNSYNQEVSNTKMNGLVEEWGFIYLTKVLLHKNFRPNRMPFCCLISYLLDLERVKFILFIYLTKVILQRIFLDCFLQRINDNPLSSINELTKIIILEWCVSSNLGLYFPWLASIKVLKVAKKGLPRL